MPRQIAYPAAGTANAAVSLWLVGLDGSRRPVEWDRADFEYLVTARWTEAALLVVVQSRDQRRMRVLEVDPTTSSTRVRREDADPTFLEIVAGTPGLTTDGRLVWTVDADDTRRLVIGDEVVTPPGLQVRAVLDVDGDTVLFAGSEEPTETHLWTASPAALERQTDEAGVHSGRRAGGTTVILSRTLQRHGTEVTVRRSRAVVARINSLAETPVLAPRLTITAFGPRRLRTAVLWPSGHQPGSARLPVLLDPYGGPGRPAGGGIAGRLPGVAVVRRPGLRGPGGRRTGSPRPGAGLGPQHQGRFRDTGAGGSGRCAARGRGRHPDLDLRRVAIRGWSFGGYLAALAVLRRPDVFHAAVAGAPVTDHRLYDTHYMERYLGHPAEEPDNYERCSLIGDAPNLRRPLLLLHGLADDNVVVAHTLQLSAALLAAGRPHCVLPLSGVTHMTPQAQIAENQLRLELEFLQRSLARPGS